MKDKENNNSIKFIGIIIILLLVIIIAILAMPKMEEAREKAFRVEATRIVDSSKVAMKNYGNGKIALKNNSSSCKINNTYCFTISELKKLNVYKSESDEYVGKVIIDVSNENKPIYNLYLKKSVDLKIIGGFREDYINMGVLAIESWEDDYEVCNCELNN